MLASSFCRLSLRGHSAIGAKTAFALQAGPLANSNIILVQARPFSKAKAADEYQIPFGKHAGTPVSQVPEDYLKFICEQQIYAKHDGMLEAIKGVVKFDVDAVPVKQQQQQQRGGFQQRNGGGFNGGYQQQRGGGFQQQQRGGNNYGNNSNSGMRGDRASSDELKWNSLISQPRKWVDMRAVKKNPRAPDFKSVDGQQALWLESKFPLPDFVKAELPSIEGKIRPYMTSEQTWANLFEQPENWFDVRGQKTRDAQPDFREKLNGGMALWLNSKYELPEGVEKKIEEAGSLWEQPPPRR